MKNNVLFTILSFCILAILFSCTNERVTLEILLEEMTDREMLTYFPEPAYTIKQFSSYDRKSLSPDKNGWFANRDYTHFIREETIEGRHEFVLFDSKGPGGIVRFWMTFAGQGASEGTLRIYIDNGEEPVIADSVLKILSGNLLAGEPLSTSVSPETEYQRRGHNLYLPLPYAEHCKITYECDAIEIDGDKRRPSIYYNINYRTYAKGTEVESFSTKVLTGAKTLVEKTCKTLLRPDFTDKKVESHSGFQILKPGDHLTFELKGKNKAIRKISVKLTAKNMNQALRSTVLSSSFDGNQTIWAPVGEFFGTGYQLFPSKTWYTEVSVDGQMTAWWVMPYQDNCTVKLTNYWEQEVVVNAEINTADYNWKKSSMYFGVAWHEHHQIHSAKPDPTQDGDWHFDVNYVNLEGQGLYVGDALTVFNTADAWWGEGDEKIFVDGEAFPSCIGTGTEDYYGYAWCRPEKFSHPFIAQPTGAGNFHPGMTVNMRYRALDAIPFTAKIQSDIELWHWAQTIMNYAMTSYWYAKPSFTCNIKPDVETVKIPVALKRSDIYPPVVDEQGIIEGEILEVIKIDGGTAGVQSGKQFGWSKNAQLWWRHAEKGDHLEMRFHIQEKGIYAITGKLTKATDYGIVRFELNGKPAGKSFNGYLPDGVKTYPFNFGTHKLNAGENILTVLIVSKDPKAKPGNMAGIDFMRFEKIK